VFTRPRVADLDRAPSEERGPDPFGVAWPDERSVPVPRPNLSMVPLDASLGIYDELGRVLLVLNPTAAAILEACDGAASFSQILGDVAQQHAVDPGSIRDDVWQTLHKLASMGLVGEAIP
jgi:hypothetical protein